MIKCNSIDDLGPKFVIQPAQESDELLTATDADNIRRLPYRWLRLEAQANKVRRSVSDVVVRPGAAATLLERQAGLSAIQGLNLTFFIDTEHDGVLGRIEIDPHDVEELFDELCVT